MKRFLKGIILIILLLLNLFFFPRETFALSFGLIPPQGQLTRGQQVDFIITIDTEGETVSSTSIGMTYQTQYLEYVKTTTGNTLDQISTTHSGSGTLFISGNKNPGFKGQGDFAIVTFKLVADAPGSTELCALFNPDTQATPQPTQPAATQAPKPTSLPKTGDIRQVNIFSYLGLGLIVLYGGFYFVSKKLK